MPFSVEIHLSAKLTVQPRILARHVIDSVGRAGINSLPVSGLNELHETVALSGINRRTKHGLATGSREGVAKRREDKEEEEEDSAEEDGGDEI